ncbi:MAG: DHA2 family efflux MFS transporter permease subunit [Patescibacteria group bacterium]|nr:DHA2 family efflux MFS transporter permease subunit [Patescibacteria group bacterium]
MKGSSLKWFVLATVIVGTFLGRLDQTIVGLALPKMIDDFGISVSSAGWIATAYIIANAVFVPIWGKLGDTIGRKKVYVFGFAIFIVGSILAALSWNLSSMLVFRVIQAIASSADYPTAMAILAVTFTDLKSRAQALGIWSSSFAAASVFGPLIGGPLIDNLGWRSIFWVNLPIGLIGIAMALAFINESVSEKKTFNFDWWGAAALGGALAALVMVLDKGLDWGWLSSGSIVSYAAIIACSLAFYFIETRHPEPIVDFKFFKNSVFNNTLANNFVIFVGLMGSIFLIPIFAQTFLGLDATESGYLFIPMAFCLVIAAPIGARFVGRIEPRYVLIGSTLLAGLSLFFFTWLDPRSTAWDIIWPLGIMAFSMGLGMPQRTSIIANVVPQQEIGVASSILALVRNIAGAFGIAVFSTMLQDSTYSKIVAISQNSAINSLAPADMAKAVQLMSLKAQISAYGDVFFAAAVVVAVGSIGAWWIKIRRDQAHQTAEVFVE